MCSTAAAFDPVREDGRLSFHLVGLYNGSILLSDLASESLWSPFNGECIHGPLQGARLPRIPVYQTTWADWRGAFPRTRALFGEESARGGHGSMNYPGQVAIDPAFLKTLVFELDERMSPGAIVLGVEVEGKAKAYSVASLTGEAIAGKLAGEQLEYVSSGTEEWYIWAAYHPETGIFGAPEDARGAHPELAGPGAKKRNRIEPLGKRSTRPRGSLLLLLLLQLALLLGSVLSLLLCLPFALVLASLVAHVFSCVI
jgi:hypothetical protein